MNNFHKYKSVSLLYFTQAFEGGIFYVLTGYIIKFVQLIIFLMIWKSLLSDGADTYGMALSQVLTYSLVSSALREQLNIVSSGFQLLWEGTIISNYTRPLPILLQLVSETVGKWIPTLVLFTIPTMAVGLLMDIKILPVSTFSAVMFILSISLSICLGFAIDFIFVSLAVYIRNASHTAYVIRNAVTLFFSGAVIPFALLPWHMGDIFRLFPFGSTASAPLSIFTGVSDTYELLLLQIAWNLILWPIAIIFFNKSQERMISYGG